MERKMGYIAKDGMLKITTNLGTVIENGIGVCTEIPYFKTNEKQAGGNPMVDGKEIFVYGDGTVRVGEADGPDRDLEDFPKLYELYEDIKKRNK